MTKKQKINYILKNAKNNENIIVYFPKDLKNWLENQTDAYIDDLFEMI